MKATDTASFLFNARRHGDVLEELPEAVRPCTVGEAYEAQAALVELLAADGQAKRPAGYKVGCTNSAAMELLGAEGPFFGRLLADAVCPSGTELAVGGAASLAVEPEFAFRVGEAMPSGEAPYDRDSVVPYLTTLLPSIELVGGCFRDITAVGVPSILADNALNAAWVTGVEREGEWSALDLAGIDVELWVDDVLRATGGADNVLGHPLNVVAWLANELNERGAQLEPGDYVTTGTCTAVERVIPGSEVRCEFGELGSVSVSLRD